MGRIFAVKRFEIHDGDGIRSTVFLKGCPLRCKWCHNPEGLMFEKQLGYLKDKCLNCGECIKVCQAHEMQESRHVYLRNKCVACGKCTSVCLGSALSLYGRDVTPQQILPLLLEDIDFYRETGGGVTISGGEPMLQYEFTRDLLLLLKSNQVHTALDTSGFAPWEQYEKVLPLVDLVLYDIKAVTEKIHQECTGVSNRLILDNVRRINETGKTIDIRIPYVPGWNDKEMENIGNFLRELHSVRFVKVLPYHCYSISRYESLNMVYPIAETRIPEKEEIDCAVKLLRSMGLRATDQTGDESVT